MQYNWELVTVIEATVKASLFASMNFVLAFELDHAFLTKVFFKAFTVLKLPKL